MPASQRPASPFWGLAALSLSMLMPSLDTSIANAGLPALAQAFGASFQAVQWIVLAYLLTITAVIVSAGRMGDLIGRRRLLLAGIALFTVASLACGGASTLWVLIAARVLQGLGAAVMMALTIAMVGSAVPKARSGSAVGLLGTMSAIGTMLGPTLGGVLISAFGWQTIFLVNEPVGIVTMGLAWRFLPADVPAPKAERIRFDILGTSVLAVTFVAYALAMTIGHGRFSTINLALILTAIAGAGLFVGIEARAASPLVPLALFRDAALSTGLINNALVATVMMATLVVGPFYLSRALGLPAVKVGLVLSIGPVLSALSGVVAGRIVDHIGPRRIAVAGLVEMAAGAVGLSVLPGVFGLWGYIIAIAILTPGYQLFQAANTTAMMTGVPAAEKGVISGTLSLSRNLGLITGAAAMGAVFALASGTSDVAGASAEAVTGGLQITFGVAGVLIVAALGLAVTGRSAAPAHAPEQ